MAWSEAQRAYVRSEIGSADPPNDSDLSDRFDALGSVSAVLLEVLRTRRADLLATGLSSSFAVTGFYSETSDASSILRALDAQIASILANAEGIDCGDYAGGRIRVHHLVRSGFNRRSRSRYGSTLA